MIPLFFLPPEAAALHAELPPPPLWWTLGLAGAASLVTAILLALS